MEPVLKPNLPAKNRSSQNDSFRPKSPHLKEELGLEICWVRRRSRIQKILLRPLRQKRNQQQVLEKASYRRSNSFRCTQEAHELCNCVTDVAMWKTALLKRISTGNNRRRLLSFCRTSFLESIFIYGFLHPEIALHNGEGCNLFYCSRKRKLHI